MATQHSQAAAESQTAGPRIAPPGDSALYNDNVHLPGVSSTLQRHFHAENALNRVLDTPPDTTYPADAADSSVYMAPAYQLRRDLDATAALIGARKVGATWRGPHLCAGERAKEPVPGNSGYEIKRSKRTGRVYAVCHYGHDYDDANAALDRELGIAAAAPLPPPLPPRAGNSGGKWAGHTAASAEIANSVRYRVTTDVAELLDATGWPRLKATGFTYSELLAAAALAGGAFWTWVDYILADGMPRAMFRGFPDGPKAIWGAQAKDAPARNHAYVRPHIWTNPNAWLGDYAPLVIVEGEKAGAAVASAAPPVWRIASAPGANELARMPLDLLLGDFTVLIMADQDDAGRNAAQKLASRLIRAGKPPHLVKIVPGLLMLEAAQRHNPAVKTDGLDAADITSDDLLALLADAKIAEWGVYAESDWDVRLPAAPAYADAVKREIPTPPRAELFACTDIQGVIRRENCLQRTEQIVIDCRECDNCFGYQCLCDTTLYLAGIDGAGEQDVLVFPYEKLKEARKFWQSQRERARQDGIQLPAARLICPRNRADRVMVIIYRQPLPARARELTLKALARAGGKWTLDTRPVTAADFCEMVPAARKQRDDDGDKMFSVKFSAWPVRYGDESDCYAGGDGTFFGPDELDGDAVTQLDPEVAARKRRGREWAEFANVADWTARLPRPISLELWQAYGKAVEDKDKPGWKATVKEIQLEAGFRLPPRLLRDSLHGDSPANRLLRRHVAGLPPEEITPPQPQPPPRPDRSYAVAVTAALAAVTAALIAAPAAAGAPDTPL